jgi:phosphate-selective porin OprO/OprP
VFGDYVAAGWLLTGEVRPYDRPRGAFGMPTPHIPFSFRDRQWRGAWEVGARWSYLDLDAPGITGGRDHAFSLGLNWYWNPHVRLMLDYGATLVDGRKPDGTVHVVQTRMQLVY